VGEIKVFVIDDSMLHIKNILRILNTESNIKVMGYAQSVKESKEKLSKMIEYPDVILLDIEMPEIDGLTYLKDELSNTQAKVLILTAYSDKYINKAREYGASGLVDKLVIKANNEQVLIDAIISTYKKKRKSSKSLIQSFPSSRVVAIGSSTGGLRIIEEILLKLPPLTPPIIIVQHMAHDKINSFIKRIQNKCNVELKVVIDKENVEHNTVYFAPYDKHIKIKRISNKQYILYTSDEDKVNNHKPSVSILFNSVAKEVGMDAMAFILTGMGNDGVDGIKNIKNRGGKTYAQDEASCTVYGMPREAVKIGAINKIIKPEMIPLYITAP